MHICIHNPSMYNNFKDEKNIKSDMNEKIQKKICVFK